MAATCSRVASLGSTTLVPSIAIKPLPEGGYLSQSDGTSWMAMYCLNLMRIAIELAQNDHVYEDMATKFFEHFLYIAKAMTDMGGKGVGLWNEEDSFYYDVLNLPDGTTLPLKVRSMVGLMPLFAVETLEPASSRSCRSLAGVWSGFSSIGLTWQTSCLAGVFPELVSAVCSHSARTPDEGSLETDARSRRVSV